MSVKDLMQAVQDTGRRHGRRLYLPHGPRSLVSPARDDGRPGRYRVTFRDFGLLGNRDEPAAVVHYEDLDDKDPQEGQWLLLYFEDGKHLGCCEQQVVEDPLGNKRVSWVELDGPLAQAHAERNVPDAFGWRDGSEMFGY